MFARTRPLMVTAGAIALIVLTAAPAWADAATPTNFRSQIIAVEGPGCLLYTSPSPRDKF